MSDIPLIWTKIARWFASIAMARDTPLIWTTKGNLPIADLEYHHEWQDDDNATVLIETYRLAGEIVKQSRHTKLKQGLVVFPELGS